MALIAPPSAYGQIRPDPEALAYAPPELLARLRADAFAYFRFVNRAWTIRACAAFADVPDLPRVRLHGDAHIEQFALTANAWGLTDFDDSSRGPQFVDVVRFLGSIDLATRQRRWTNHLSAVTERFLDGFRRGLSEPDDQPPEPDIVRHLRRLTPATRAAFLEWGQGQMQPMEGALSKSVDEGMKLLDTFIRPERPDIAPGYFTTVRFGRLRMGVGSAATRKILIRVQGPSTDPEDDVLLEGKEVANLDGIDCLDRPPLTRARRVIDGTRQLGRLKHDILAMGPTLLIPSVGDRAQHWLEWWIRSWDPSYRELRIGDLRSVQDLSDIVYDAGIQLGAGKAKDAAIRKQALSSLLRLKGRVRTETASMVDELLAGWRELGGQ